MAARCLAQESRGVKTRIGPGACCIAMGKLGGMRASSALFVAANGVSAAAGLAPATGGNLIPSMPAH